MEGRLFMIRVDGKVAGECRLTYTAGDATSGLASANYALAYRGGTLTVTPAPLVVAPDDRTRAYGAANPALADAVRLAWAFDLSI